MQIVIDFDDKAYEMLKDDIFIVSGVRSGKSFALNVCNAIANGTPLPKGHGRLGDLDKLEKDMENGIMAGLLEEGYEKYTRIFNLDDCVERVKWADTIIEADKER